MRRNGEENFADFDRGCSTSNLVRQRLLISRRVSSEIATSLHATHKNKASFFLLKTLVRLFGMTFAENSLDNTPPLGRESKHTQ